MSGKQEISVNSVRGPRSLIDALAVEMLRGLDLFEKEQPGNYFNSFIILFYVVKYSVDLVSTGVS